MDFSFAGTVALIVLGTIYCLIGVGGGHRLHFWHWGWTIPASVLVIPAFALVCGWAWKIDQTDVALVIGVVEGGSFLLGALIFEANRFWSHFIKKERPVETLARMAPQTQIHRPGDLYNRYH